MRLLKVIEQLERLLKLHGDTIVECRNSAGDFSDIDNIKAESLVQGSDKHICIDS